MTKTVEIGGVKIGGGGPLGFIAGPCVIVDQKMMEEIAVTIRDAAVSLGAPYIFKASYDKANRSSAGSFRGPGLESGLEMLKRVRDKTGVPIISDVHNVEEAEKAAKILDCLQIPAFLCRQTDLLYAAADTGRPVNIKKGQFMSPQQMAGVIDKIENRGNKNILLTERGVTFGYSNLVVDMRSLVIMREFGYPVVFDATHSVQLPGGLGAASGGERRFVAPLARAAVATGVDAVFLETYPDPDNDAPCDGPNSLFLTDVPELMKTLMAIENSARLDLS